MEIRGHQKRECCCLEVDNDYRYQESYAACEVSGTGTHYSFETRASKGRRVVANSTVAHETLIALYMVVHRELLIPQPNVPVTPEVVFADDLLARDANWTIYAFTSEETESGFHVSNESESWHENEQRLEVIAESGLLTEN